MAGRAVSSYLSLNRRAPVAVAVAAVASGFPILFNEFAWDDEYIVLDNPAIRDLSNVFGFFSTPWASGVGYALGDVQNRPYYRPLALASMAVDWALAGGPEPVVFHATNLVVHTLASVFLFLWLRRLWPDKETLVTAVAVLWAIHPVHTEAVALVTYRTTLLAGLFTFAGLWALARPQGRRWLWVLTGLACFASGLLSKETMLVFPALLFLADLWATPAPPLERAIGKARVLSVYLPLALLAGAWWLWRSHVTESGLYDWFEGLAPWQKALMVPRILFLYVRLCVLPYPLCPFYDWDILGVPTSLFEADILAGLLLGVGLLAGVVLAWGRAPEVAFGLAFFVTALLPVSHIVPFFDAAGERFLYVPLAGFLVAVVGAVGRAWLLLRVRWFFAGTRGAFLAILITIFSLMTITRHTDWRDSETILRVTRRDFPHSVSANLGLGRLLLAQDRFAEAVHPLSDVVRLAPRLSVGFGLLAATQALIGDVRGAKDTLTRAPLPEPRLLSAAQVARGELLKRGAADLVRRIGL